MFLWISSGTTGYEQVQPVYEYLWPTSSATWLPKPYTFVVKLCLRSRTITIFSRQAWIASYWFAKRQVLLLCKLLLSSYLTTHLPIFIGADVPCGKICCIHFVSLLSSLPLSLPPPVYLPFPVPLSLFSIQLHVAADGDLNIPACLLFPSVIVL